MSSLLKTLIPFKLHPANIPNPPEAALGCSGRSWVSQVPNMQQEKVSVWNKIIKPRVKCNPELLRSINVSARKGWSHQPQLAFFRETAKQNELERRWMGEMKGIILHFSQKPASRLVASTSSALAAGWLGNYFVLHQSCKWVMIMRIPALPHLCCTISNTQKVMCLSSPFTCMTTEFFVGLGLMGWGCTPTGQEGKGETWDNPSGLESLDTQSHIITGNKRGIKVIPSQGFFPKTRYKNIQLYKLSIIHYNNILLYIIEISIHWENWTIT